MAAIDVCTPIKGRVFSTKTAGGRLPLTPSPKFYPKLQFAKETPPSIHTTPIFAQATSKSTIRKSVKSNIASRNSPRSLELGLSEWTLTGTPSKASQAQAGRPGLKARPHNKSSVRIAYNAADRFIPNRTASEAICNVGTGKIDHRPKSSHSSSSSQGSSVLASNAATAGGAFDIGSSNHATEDDITSALHGLTVNDRDEDSEGNGKSKYTKPAPDAVAYESSIANACGVNLNTRILAFKPAPPESNKPIDLRSQYNRPLKPVNSLSAQLRRRILTSPERVLDAPNIVDDYYLNLLDWSCNNQVAIGLGQSVYVWSADTGSVSSLLETSPDTYISSLRWSGDGAYVSVGLGTGEVQIWDVEEGTKLRSMFGHETRVSVMSKSHLLFVILVSIYLTLFIQVGTNIFSLRVLAMAGSSTMTCVSPRTRSLSWSRILAKCVAWNGVAMARSWHRAATTT